MGNEGMNFSPVTVSTVFLMHFAKAYQNMPGKWKQDVDIPIGVSLEQSEEFLDGRNKEMFLTFMRGMLQWRPEDRKTAKELLQDPWLNDQV